MYQIWDIIQNDSDGFSMKVLIKDQSIKDVTELYFSMCSSCVGGLHDKELWLVEESEQLVNEVKYKFKWGKH